MNPAEFRNIARAEHEMWWFRGMRSILRAWLTRLENTSFKNVLEAGCGTGYMSHWLSQQFHWPITPLDLDFGALAYSSSRRRTQANIAALPFRDATFDALLSLDVIVHFPRGEESRALTEFHRVLQPGAPLILRVSALDSLRSRHSEFVHERQRFTASRLRRALQDSGFAVDHLSYCQSFLLPVAFLKFRLWEPLTNAPAASGVEVPAAPLNQILQLPLELEAKLLAAGCNLPLGQSLLVLARKNP
jgi:SAM-dependent methyltransferase